MLPPPAIARIVRTVCFELFPGLTTPRAIRYLSAMCAVGLLASRHIPDLVKAMEEGKHDVVSGTRYGLGGGVSIPLATVYRIPRWLSHMVPVSPA